MDSAADKTTLIPLNRVILRPDDWPRDRMDDDRVELFAGLWSVGEEFPPIEVVLYERGRYLLADGVHRSFSAVRAGVHEIRATIIEPDGAETASACAFRRALETSTRTSLPLTKAERRRAVQRLAADQPGLSHRAVARLVGVSHDTVGRWLREDDEATGSPEDPVRPSITAQQVARQLVAHLVRLDDSRGVLDHLAPSRMGRHLADAYVARLGIAALPEARRLAQWTAAAVRDLENRE